MDSGSYILFAGGSAGPGSGAALVLRGSASFGGLRAEGAGRFGSGSGGFGGRGSVWLGLG